MSLKTLEKRNAPGGGSASPESLKDLQNSVEELVLRARKRSEELEVRIQKAETSVEEKRSELDKWKNDIALQFTELNKTVEELGKVAARSQAAGSGVQFSKDKNENYEIECRALSALIRHHGKREEAIANAKDELEKRALSSLTGEDGGYTVPKIIETKIIQKVYEIAGTRKVVQALQTSSNIVTVLKGSGVSVTVGDEKDPYTDQNHKFETIDIRINDIKAAIYIPNNLLDDTGVNLVAYLSENVSAAIAEKEDELFAKGTGSKQPRGIYVNPDLITTLYNKSSAPTGYVKTKVAAALSDGSNNGVDQLKRLITSIKAGYRNGAVWQMNSSTMAEVAILKDSYGQYLWHVDASGAFPGVFLGYGININEFIDDIAANKFPIGFGNLGRAYRIYDRSGLISWRDESIRRLQDQTAFGFKERLGGDTVDPLAFKLLKCEA